jgi:integrase
VTFVQGSKRLLRGSKSDGVYELRVFTGRDTLTGKMRQVSRTHHGGVTSANAALRNLIEDVESGRSGGASATFGVLLDAWLDQITSEGRAPTTLREYRRIVEKTIRPALGATPLRKLTPHNIDRLYAALTDRGLAPSSVRQVHAILRASCRQGVKWGWLRSNPAADASPPKLNSQPEVTPTPAQVRAMIVAAEADDPDMAALIALAAMTGARRGELCGLRWGDVDWKAATLTIERSVAVMGRRNIVIKDTKTHAARRLALDDFGIEVLRRHLVEAKSRAKDLGGKVMPSAPIFTYDGVNPINPDTVTRYARSIATKVGVDCHLHALRHFAATEMVGGGTDIRTVAGRLGHKDPSTTLRVYSHALPERDREAAGLLGRSLTARVETEVPEPST